MFIPGYPPPPERLLARFLPPLAEGVAAHYIEQHTQPGELVLDPFGQSPRVAIEALHLERRVIVVNFNPISRLALSLAARPPRVKDLRSALTLLGETRKAAELLEDYLGGLYLTRCASCGASAPADAFEWDTDVDADAPVEKTYICQQHGPMRALCDDADRALARRFAHGGLDYHYLLDRVAALDDPDRAHAEEALAVYPPRALAAIAAALQKLDALKPEPEPRRLLCGLLVAAFDAACPLAQERPRALTGPKRFVEHNFWLAMENAVGTLAGVPARDRSLALPDLLSSAERVGIHAHAGTVRDLMGSLPEHCCSLVISAFPRPNQAYWTLSALWSAWLWGRESSTALRTVLRRRRYDWTWHEEALRRTLTIITPALAEGGSIVGLLSESEPGFNAAVLSAADGAGFSIASAALRADTAEAQLTWARAQTPPSGFTGSILEVAVKSTARESAAETLAARGEPSRWVTVHFAAWRALAEKRLLSAIPAEPVSAVTHLLDPVFRDGGLFRRLDADPDDELATGLWWLAETEARDGVERDAVSLRAEDSAWPSPPRAPQVVSLSTPLADRAEAEVLRLLSATPSEAIAEHDVMHAACAALPGLLTPGRGLVLACLSSYAGKVEVDTWRLRPEDVSAARAQELESIQAELRALGTRHGFDVAGANPLEWREDGQVVYLFAAITSAVISRYLLGPRSAARQSFLVLPGGRAGLVEFKLRRDPRLRAVLAEGHWNILKFRHVRRMAGDSELTRATLGPALAADPLEEAKQLALMDK